ncbi:MAG: hypothetical protein HY363_03925 [Candidatus Aenigmarchaeota archaeon]|nr:hypothetical protein [Candidatus Aenigmarchaeota archaeon]
MKNLVLVALLLCASVSAMSGTVPLLALTELSNGTQLGSATELRLDVSGGSERVFLETAPLTKISTQVSMRFAQQIACHEFGIDCGDKDFFFAIKALPGPIVGGPSAGAAAAIAVAATLQNASINPKIAITGTINSGGLIGPVGGIEKKIGAAAGKGYTTVLIPAGTRYQKNPFVANSTDLVAVGARLNITVVEVATIREAYGIFTGVQVMKNSNMLIIEPMYGETMKRIANELCSRTAVLRSKINESNELLLNFSVRAAEALALNTSYSAASFCFRANLLAKEIINSKNNSGNFSWELGVLDSRLEYLEDKLEQEEITTLTDLQTYIVVKDRLKEAREGLLEAEVEKGAVQQRRLLSYSEERLISAKAWSAFFNLSGNSLRLTPEALLKTCVSKVAEAEERYNYVISVLPDSLKETRRALDRAYLEYSNESYISCIGSASKAKAEADVVMGLLGVGDDRLNDILDIKLEIVKQQLLRAQEEGVFPIIGYSYYEYAQSLAPVDVSSALLFSEYALELSDLGVYFEKPQKQQIVSLKIDLFSIGLGLLAGVFLTGVYYTVAFKFIARKKR